MANEQSNHENIDECGTQFELDWRSAADRWWRRPRTDSGVNDRLCVPSFSFDDDLFFTNGLAEGKFRTFGRTIEEKRAKIEIERKAVRIKAFAD